MRIVFAGTPEFALPALGACAASKHDLVAVYTQPDRPAGRGRKLTPSPVKQRALELGLPVLQPSSLKPAEAQTELAALKPALMVVIAYGLILPQAVLDIPALGCVNLHASLLPRWRGAAPIQRAILAGDTETGVTLMRMEAGLDTGPMLATQSATIAADETGQTLHDRLAQISGQLLAANLDALAARSLRAEPQPATGVTYAHKLEKAEAKLDWSRPAHELARAVRAFNPWPVAFGELAGEPVRIWQAGVPMDRADAAPGTILRADAAGIDIATGRGVLRALKLQWPGGRALTAAEASNGRKLAGQHFD